ncbi:hypothetical protein NE237_017182 [Protea cynaroides]|uniref:Pentatricopeptide repeat-containing protein n=1 Tax=Protea cynaroides TaxID=273540 RepID=A0A9Q0K7K4_9MAGN|nr:hypothetical protein NE237_017182 [Protea cynaroides]
MSKRGESNAVCNANDGAPASVKELPDFESAWVEFNQMPKRDLIFWNLFIDELFNRMPTRNKVSWVIMIDEFPEFGSVNTVRCLSDDMHERDDVAWYSMMKGNVQNGFRSEALKLFCGKQTEGNSILDHATLVRALPAAAALGRINERISTLHYIEKNVLPVDEKLGVAFIDMYSKCRDTNDAMWVFKNLEEKGVDHWNAMINGLAIFGIGELAFNFFVEMERHSVMSDDITFIGILNVCGHAGLLKKGLMCVGLMRRAYNIKPKLPHYGGMVDILGRAGHPRFLSSGWDFLLKKPRGLTQNNFFNNYWRNLEYKVLVYGDGNVTITLRVPS